MFAGRGAGIINFIPSEYVSRSHAKIWLEGEQWKIQDLKSFNGTFLIRDGETHQLKRFESFNLMPNDVIGLGISPLIWNQKDACINDPGKP